MTRLSLALVAFLEIICNGSALNGVPSSRLRAATGIARVSECGKGSCLTRRLATLEESSEFAAFPSKEGKMQQSLREVRSRQEELEDMTGKDLVRTLDWMQLPRWRSASLKATETPLSTLSLVLKTYDDIPKMLGLDEEDALGAYRSVLFISFVVGAFLANGPLMNWLFPMDPTYFPSALNAPGPPVEVDVTALRQAARDSDIKFQLRWLWSAFFNTLPLGVGFVGLFARDQLDEALLRIRCAIDPAFRRRVTFHECGHLLTAYLCGLPVTGAALKTGVEIDIAGALRADAAARGSPEDELLRTSESSEEIWRQKMMQGTSGVEVSNDDRGPAAVGEAINGLVSARFWPETLLNSVCIVSMGGIMAEVLDTGAAKGGNADMRSLERLLYSAIPEVPLETGTGIDNQQFGRKVNPANEERQDRIRWAAVEALTLLKENEKVLRALVEACGVDGQDDSNAAWSFKSPLVAPVVFPRIAEIVEIIESTE